MKYLTHTLVVTGLVASLGTTVFAQDMDPKLVTCGDFMAMSPEEQTDSVIALKDAKMEADTATSTSTESSTATDTDTSETSTESDTSTGTSAATDTDTSATADTTASGDVMTDPEVEALKTACDGNADALAMDQLEAS